MFIIKHRPTGQYFHQEQKIILFRTPQEAEMFLNGFGNYALNRAIAEAEEPAPFVMMRVQEVLVGCQILPIDFDIDNSPEVKTIWMHELES
jgi:hypothetical protein